MDSNSEISTANSIAAGEQSSLDSTAQTGNANGADLQGEIYKKIKSTREMYLPELNALLRKISFKVHQHDSLPQRPQNEQIEKLKMFKCTLERIVLFLRLEKHDIQPSHKEKLLAVEKHINFFLISNRPHKSGASLLQGQFPQPPMHTSQPTLIQPSATQSSSLSNLQQNQQSTVQQPTQSAIHKQSQSVLRQQQAPRLHQHKASMPPQPVIPAQQHKQQQLVAQEAGSANLQQSQLVGQKRAMPYDQQQLPQQRLVGQLNNYNNLQQQQQLLKQQNYLQNKYQQQLGSQSNVAGVQQRQFTGSQQPGNSNLTSDQHPMNLLQQSEAPLQKQMLQNTTTLLPSQCHQSQSDTAQQQMMSQGQSQPGQVQPPLSLQQQKNKLQMEMQQRLQTSSPLLQQQNVIEQKKQLYQPLRATPEPSSNSTVQMRDANGADWQEEIYQKVMSMKEIPELNDLYQRIASKMQQAKDTCAHETSTMGSGRQDSGSDFIRLDWSFDGLGSGWNSACISGIATSGFDRLGSSSNERLLRND